MYWYDGRAIDSDRLELKIDNPGLCYGATVFTTMRVYRRSLNDPQTYWQSHCDRLKASIERFGWVEPQWQQIRRGVESLLEYYPVLRIAIFPDGKEWIVGRDLPADLSRLRAQGITAWVARDSLDSLYRRELPQHKTGNYLAGYLARTHAVRCGAREAILLDGLGNWLETSTGTLWGWKDDRWYTPSLDSGILPGIARSRWLDFFHDRQLEVIESIWTPEFASTLEGLSYSNCVVDFVPIVRVIEEKDTWHYRIKKPE